MLLTAGFALAVLVEIASGAPIKVADNLLDLSYPYVNKTMVYHPVNRPIFFLKTAYSDTHKVGYNKMFIEGFSFETNEHGGTHYDAPTHFCDEPHCWSPENIPLSAFHGEACVINIVESAAKNPRYSITINDLINYERKYGVIPDGAYVIMYSGWGKYSNNVTAYLGDTSDSSKMAWPGFSGAATKWLLDNRKIKGFGVDTVSLDAGGLSFMMSHVLALGRNKIVLENIANLEKLPARGTTIYAFPMNIKGGSGGPARVIAMWNNGGNMAAMSVFQIVVFVVLSVRAALV